MADSGATLIVADSGPLIGLTKLGLLDLLPRCFDAVYIPRTVLSEATGSRTHPDAETLLRFIAANDGGRIRIAPGTVTQLTLEVPRPASVGRETLTHATTGSPPPDRWTRS